MKKRYGQLFTLAGVFSLIICGCSSTTGVDVTPKSTQTVLEASGQEHGQEHTQAESLDLVSESDALSVPVVITEQVSASSKEEELLQLLDMTLGNPMWYENGYCQRAYAGFYGSPIQTEADFHERYEQITWNSTTSKTKCYSGVSANGEVYEQSHSYYVERKNDEQYYLWNELSPNKINICNDDVVGIKEQLANMNYRAFEEYQASDYGEVKYLSTHTNSAELLKNMNLSFDEWINALSGVDMDKIPAFDVYILFQFIDNELSTISIAGYTSKLQETEGLELIHNTQISFCFQDMGKEYLIELPAEMVSIYQGIY